MQPSLTFVPIPPMKCKLPKEKEDFNNLFKSQSNDISTFHSAISSETRDIKSYRPYISALANALNSSQVRNKTLNSKFTDPFHPKSKDTSSSIITEMTNACWNYASDLMQNLHSLDSSDETALKSMRPLISDLMACVNALNMLTDPSENHDLVTKAGHRKDHPYITRDVVHMLQSYVNYIADSWQLACILSKNPTLTPPIMTLCLNDITACISEAKSLPKEAGSFFVSVFLAIYRYLQLLIRLQLGKNSQDQTQYGIAIAYYNEGIEIAKRPLNFVESNNDETSQSDDEEKEKEKSKHKGKESKKKDKDKEKNKDKDKSKIRINNDVITNLNAEIKIFQDALTESFNTAKTDNQKIYCQAIPDEVDFPAPSPKANVQPSESLLDQAGDASKPDANQKSQPGQPQPQIQQTQQLNQQQMLQMQQMQMMQQMQQMQMQQTQPMDPQQMLQMQQMMQSQQLDPQTMQQYQLFLQQQQQLQQQQLQQQQQFQQQQLQQQQLQQQQLQQQQLQQQQLQQQQLQQQQLQQQQLQQQKLQQQQLQQQKLQQQQLQQTQQPHIQQQFQQPQQLPQIQQTQQPHIQQQQQFQQQSQQIQPQPQQQASHNDTAAVDKFVPSGSPVNDWMKVLALKEQAKSGYEEKYAELQARLQASYQAEQSGSSTSENSKRIQAKMDMAQKIIQCFSAAEKNDGIIQKNVFQYQANPKEDQLEPINIMINKSYQFYASTLKQLKALN